MNAILTLTIRLDPDHPRGMKLLNGIAGAIAKELSEEQRAQLVEQIKAEQKRLARKKGV